MTADSPARSNIVGGHRPPLQKDLTAPDTLSSNDPTALSQLDGKGLAAFQQQTP